MRYLLALDQGTTSSRAIIFDVTGRLISSVNIEFEQIYPKPGWVEHNPMDILSSQVEAMKRAVEQAGISPAEIAAIGITNQRETTLLWDKMTGEPVYNAIVWQCRRTAPECEALKKQGLESEIKRRTGLLPDAYFSGTKVKWMLDNVPGARERAQRGDLMFGTVDSWLIYNLSGELAHVTDYSNASRTMLFNIHTLKWDELILQALNIPQVLLPEVVPNSGRIAMLDKKYLGVEIPISGLAGDQQAALFGQGCFEPGSAKNTYGTGGFLLLNTGERCIESKNGLISTIAWNIRGKTTYALEGSVFIAGAAIQWLRDELGIIETAEQSEALAAEVPDNGGVYFVPAFTGLGAPYWDMYARGAIVGLTRGSGKAHICRAALEAIAYQSRDVLDAMQRDSGMALKALSVDGGASRNDLLMQFQADITGAPVDRPAVVETTALGAACFAGLGEGLWASTDELKAFRRRQRLFTPDMPPEKREALYDEWNRAVERSEHWADRD